MDTNESAGMTSNRPYLLRAIYDWISDNGLTPYVLVDAAQPGVKVPAHVVKNGQVVLNLAMRAVANLDLGNDKIGFQAKAATRDITTFLEYTAEPAALERQSVGVWVILFLAGLTFLLYLVKQEYWKDVHEQHDEH